MEHPLTGPLGSSIHGNDLDKTFSRAASDPNVTVEDDRPLLTTEEKDDHTLSRQLSEGQRNRKFLEDEATESRLKWPIRHNSTSADPITRARRMRRLEGVINKATHRESPRRTTSLPEQGSIRRVRTAPTRTSAAVTPRFLWFAGSSSSSTGNLLRRASNHIRAKPRPEDASPVLMPAEESNNISDSVPALSDEKLKEEDSIPRVNSPGNQQQSRPHCLPALHLWVHRRNGQDPKTALSRAPSSESQSIKGATADTATTLTDVHVLPISPQSDKELWFATSSSSDHESSSSSIQVVESGHGTYEVFWDEPSPTQDDGPEEIHQNEDNPAVPLAEDVQTGGSPLGLSRVDSKLKEWSFSRNTGLPGKGKSHPRFKSYVEVFQEPEEPQFDFDPNETDIFMAPPNSKLQTPNSSGHQSRLSSRQLSEKGSVKSTSPSGSEASDSEEEIFTAPRRIEQVQVLSGYHSPRPNRPLRMSDRQRQQSRSLSELSNATQEDHLLQHHRDSVIIMHERCMGDWVSSHAPRDSISVARDRITRKYRQPEGVRGPVTAPLDIPRLQQVTFMGGLSPIPDASPSNPRHVLDEKPSIAQISR